MVYKAYSEITEGLEKTKKLIVYAIVVLAELIVNLVLIFAYF